MRARCPASAANLGPGFDTLGLALELYVEVEVEAAPALVVRSSGEGSHLAADHTHLAARTAAEVVGHNRLAVTVRSDIPVGRGLGSSAALVVASAAAAGSDRPLQLAARWDGHPENAAASVLGGLVTATVVGEAVSAEPLPLDPDLRVVVLVPDRELATPGARAVLPAMVAHEDATFNLGRMGLLIAGLADTSRLRPEATEDRLHQAARQGLFPEAPGLLRGLVAAGARAACGSGAGPALIGFCEAGAGDRVRARSEELLERSGVAGRALLLRPDITGLSVEGAGGAGVGSTGPA